EELPHSAHVATIESCLKAGRRGRASTDPLKDTSRYLALMWSKAALVARAADCFFPGAGMFWWVDFGLAHAAGAHPDDELDELVEKVEAPIHLTVRWQPSRREVEDRTAYFRDTPGAKVGGSLFGARPGEARWLADRMDDEVGRCLASGWPTTEEVLLGAVLAEHPDACEVHYASPRTTLVNLLGTRSDPYVALDAARALTEDGQAPRALELVLALEAAERNGELHLGELAEVQLYDRLLVAAWYAGDEDEARRAALILERLRHDVLPGTPAGEATLEPRIRANVALALALGSRPGTAS
ncbi:MAG TPA: hypothetical protein VMD59_24595, partial [Acidimicrobiales bacterium]|nr:hypothetical protein [Acidimicrobiales bacterium]